MQTVKERHNPKRTISKVVLGTLYASLGGVILFGFILALRTTNWLDSSFGNLSAEQLLPLLVHNNIGATLVENAEDVLKYKILLPSVIAGIVGLGLGLAAYKNRKRRVASTFGVLLLVVTMVYSSIKLPLKDLLLTQLDNSDFIAENYVDPSSVVHLPEQKRNLIHIFMESVENSYYDEANGGYDQDNLMPELMQLNLTNIHFSHRENMLGGPHQTFGARHSVAGMINMQAGVPMKTSVIHGTSKDMYYPSFTTIGDILAAAGYNNEIMLGADANWGGLGQYYRKHGDFLVFDYNYALDHGYLPTDYHEWWGYEDDKLYDFAKQELLRLANCQQPFYFILENADTHFPDGYKSSKMTKEPFNSQYANVIHYSQAEVVKFVKWCQKQAFYDNTTIVITGDHRSMDLNFFQGWNPNYERTIVNMYINPIKSASRQRMYNRQFAPFDLFPTTLSAIGCNIEGNRAGLGTDLFSDTPTLLEEIGFDRLNLDLAKGSPFYFK